MSQTSKDMQQKESFVVSQSSKENAPNIPIDPSSSNRVIRSENVTCLKKPEVGVLNQRSPDVVNGGVDEVVGMIVEDTVIQELAMSAVEEGGVVMVSLS